MNLKLCLLAFICHTLNVSAQQVSVNKTGKLQVGDSLPPLVLKKVYNTDVSSIDMSSLQNKLVLVDFWATWCGSCVKAFPTLDSIKAVLGDSLQVILVTSYNNPVDEDRLLQFLTRYQQRTGAALAYPAVLKDTVLTRNFSIPYIPYYVWLWNGRVQSMTPPKDLSVPQIRQFMRNPL